MLEEFIGKKIKHKVNFAIRRGQSYPIYSMLQDDPVALEIEKIAESKGYEVRFLHPGSFATADFREDRINVNMIGDTLVSTEPHFMDFEITEIEIG